MTKDTTDLLNKLESIKHLIPLNYLKAKPVFFENQPTDLRNLLKFIPIDKLNTENGLVQIPSKPISKCLELTQKNGEEVL